MQSKDILVGEETDKTLAEIDDKIREMLGERPLPPYNEEQEAMPSEKALSELESTISKRKGKKPSETSPKVKEEFNQIYTASPEELDAVYEKMLQGEKDTYKELMEIFASAVGFSGGIQRFLNVAINQLHLGDINLKKDRLDQMSENLLDVKVLAVLINTLTANTKREEVEQIESSLYSKLLHSYFNLHPKDPITAASTDIQRVINNGLKDLTSELHKSSAKQNETLSNFTKKIETKLRRV